MPLHNARTLSTEELKEYRQKYLEKDRITVRSEPRIVDPPVGVAESEPPPAIPTTKRTPREVFDNQMEYQRRFLTKSREELAKMVRFVKMAEPDLLGHLSDEECLRILLDRQRTMAAESVERVFRARGRERELQIKTQGW